MMLMLMMILSLNKIIKILFDESFYFLVVNYPFIKNGDLKYFFYILFYLKNFKILSI